MHNLNDLYNGLYNWIIISKHNFYIYVNVCFIQTSTTRLHDARPGEPLSISQYMSLKNLLPDSSTIPVTVVVLLMRFTSPAYFKLEVNLSCSGGEQD